MHSYFCTIFFLVYMIQIYCLKLIFERPLCSRYNDLTNDIKKYHFIFKKSKDWIIYICRVISLALTAFYWFTSLSKNKLIITSLYYYRHIVQLYTYLIVYIYRCLTAYVGLPLLCTHRTILQIHHILSCQCLIWGNDRKVEEVVSTFNVWEMPPFPPTPSWKPLLANLTA